MLAVLFVVVVGRLELEYDASNKQLLPVLLSRSYSILITFCAVSYAIFSIVKTAETLFFKRPISSPVLTLVVSKARMTPWQTVAGAVTSYFLTIYAFALLYQSLSVANPLRFNIALDLPTSLYFSVVTITTVGYGDIFANGRLARLLVSIEILVGVGYQIFFFSIIAGQIRRAPLDPKDTREPRVRRGFAWRRRRR